ncbi:MAG: HD domain-containing protein [Gemmatimonadetes bacterium]|nr:HD domain-containing protein [Gemmatimonadota bacterium]
MKMILQPVRERWRRGIRDFAKQAQLDHQFHHKKKVIRSALYGDMGFDEDEMRLVESFYLQRMRHISQMGLLHLVYPDARHSRFEHMLGVLHSLKDLLGAAQAGHFKDGLSEVRRKELRFAALLHDIGHGPFSHTTETLLELTGIDAILHLSADNEEEGKTKHHERRCRDMLLDLDVQLENLGILSYGLSDYFRHQGLEPSVVAALVTSARSHKPLNLLSGAFDVDKVDYFRRDAFFTGTRGGGVDTDAIRRGMRLVGNSDALAIGFDKRMVVHLLHAMYGRIQVYAVTAFHPVVRTASALLLVAGDLALRALPADAAALILVNLELMNDRELLTVLDTAARECEGADGALLQRVLQRIEMRRLPKRLVTLSPQEFESVLGEAIPTLSQLGGRGRLPPLVYCRVSTIADGKYSQYLSEDSTPDDLVIVEMTPADAWRSAGAEPSAKSELDSLCDILLCDESPGRPISLADWLDANSGPDSAKLIAESLQAYRRATWRGLVLVPATLKHRLAELGLVQQFLKDLGRCLKQPENCLPYVRSRGSKRVLDEVSRIVLDWRLRLESQDQNRAARSARPKAKVRSKKKPPSPRKGKAARKRR